MRNIRKFNTLTEYQEYKNSGNWIIPNLSLSKDLGQLFFESVQDDGDNDGGEVDPFNGYEYVDLGLPSGTLWAKYNIGGNSESDYGLYFAWGEVIGYKDASSGKSFSPDDYKFENGDACDGKFTKYDSSDNKTVLELEDDAASVNMGGSWHMPSKEQFEELINPYYTTTTWTTVNGINGRKITSKTNGNTLFLPASGGCDWGSVYDVGSGGYYWSSSLNEDSPGSAWNLNFYSGGINVYDSSRYNGHTVRGVVG